MRTAAVKLSSLSFATWWQSRWKIPQVTETKSSSGWHLESLTKYKHWKIYFYFRYNFHLHGADTWFFSVVMTRGLSLLSSQICWGQEQMGQGAAPWLLLHFTNSFCILALEQKIMANVQVLSRTDQGQSPAPSFGTWWPTLETSCRPRRLTCSSQTSTKTVTAS